MNNIELYLDIKKWETIYHLGWLVVTGALVVLGYWRGHRNGFALRNMPLGKQHVKLTMEDILGAFGPSSPNDIPTQTAKMRDMYSAVKDAAREKIVNDRGSKMRGI